MNVNFQLILSLWLSVCFSLKVNAEGPPINMDGTISGQYKGIALTLSQKIQLETQRYIKLTASQQKLAGLNNEVEELFVLTSNYNDCTCGLTYAIWFHTDSIAVFGSDYSSYDTMPNGAVLPGRALRQIAYLKSKEHQTLCLTIATNGDLYYKNQKRSVEIDSLYTLAEEITSNLDSLNQARDSESVTDENFLFMYMPPLHGNTNREKVLFTFYQLHQFNSRYHLGNFIYQ
jgi:hypothetical protein